MEEDNKLIESILSQAEQESERILERARTALDDKQRSLEGRKNQIKKETDDKILQRTGDIERRTESAVNSERRRIKLKRREVLHSSVLESVALKMEKMIGTEEYNEVTAKWIAEGAIAVGTSEVTARCSFKERITEDILKKSEMLVKEHTGMTVKIIADSAAPLTAQGVTVSSPDGRISYSNLVSSRIRRFSEDIKSIITSEPEEEPV